MTARASTLTTSRLLSGRPVYTSGRLLRDVTTTGVPVLLDPVTGGELATDKPPVFVLSTERAATDGHIVMQEWDVTRADGVGIPVLWCHDSRGDLLGQWEGFEVRDVGGAGRETIARCMMDPGHEDAMEYLGQIRRGFLRAVSIGWQPGAMVRRGDLAEDDPRHKAKEEDECGLPAEGYVMGSPEEPNRMFECSLVPVPADDGAFAVERAYTRADEALARAAGRGLPTSSADFEALLTAIAGDPRARAFLTGQISRLLPAVVEREVAAALARRGATDNPPSRRKGIVTFKG